MWIWPSSSLNSVNSYWRRQEKHPVILLPVPHRKRLCGVDSILEDQSATQTKKSLFKLIKTVCAAKLNSLLLNMYLELGVNRVDNSLLNMGNKNQL